MSDQALKRTPLACVTCRKSKRKCDGVRPTCQECQRHARTCEYPGGRRRRATDSANKGYVRHLEQQVHTYSTLLGHVLHPEISPPDTISPETTGNDSSRPVRSPADPLSSRPDRIPEDISQLGWRVTSDATGSRRLMGPGSVFCFSVTPPEPMFGEVADESSDRFTTDSRDLALLHHLKARFLQCVNPYYRFVSQCDRETLEGISTAPPHMQLFYCALLALGACHSSLQEARPVGDSFYRHAEGLVVKCYRSSPDLFLVRGLSMLALRGLCLGMDNAAWMYLSLASGLVEQTGLYMSGLPDIANNTGLQCQAEAFWSFYFVDRLAIAILGRSAFRWHSQTQIGTAEAYARLTPDEIAFQRSCQLWYLYDIHMRKITPLQRNELSVSEKEHVLLTARQELASFYAATHQALGVNKDSQLPPAAYIFEIGYSTAQILMHRPFLNKTSCVTARLAVETTLDALADVTKNIMLYRKYYTFDAMPIYVIFHLARAAIAQLFASLFHGTRGKPSSALKLCLGALEEMHTTWPKRAQQAIQLVREVAARWNATWVLPLHHSGIPSSQ